jgi:hypothetical protein
MSQSTGYAQTSRCARASHRLGVLALLLLVLSGYLVFALMHRQALTHDDVIVLSYGEVICQVLAVVAALAAFTLGVLGLGNIGRGAGQVKGRGLAVSGLVTATLTLLPLALVYLVLLPIAAWKVPKVESSNNLKALGLAMVEYHDLYGRLPPAVLRDPSLGDRAQPYSWRVALLPLLGEKNLFHQYHRDEPWNSPANTAVLEQMPGVFARPGRRVADNLTYYQVLVGPGTAFPRPDVSSKLRDFPQGAAQTILIVEAADPVPWTKPEDLSYDPEGPLPKLGGVVGRGCHLVFADVTVRWIEAEQQESELRTHVPRDGR